MRWLLTLTVAAVAAGITTADDPKKDGKMKKHELKVSFATPNPTWTANITEVRVVGQEIWVKVDAQTDGGVGPAVIGTAEATGSVEAPDLPVRYAVFGKTWQWKNDEKGITFADDVGKDEKDKWEKAWKDGKPLTLTKKDK
jgi:hypothetical protein